MRRGVLAGLFAVYLGLLVWLVMWKLHVPFIGRDDMREIKLIPFATGGGYGASSPVEALGNLLVFVPLGVYLAALAPGWRWWRAAAIAAALSLGFEVAQYVTAAGSSDATDVIMNTAGGVAGFALVALARRRLGPRVLPVLTRLLGTGTVLALLATGAFVATLPRMSTPPAGSGDVSWSGGAVLAP